MNPFRTLRPQRGSGPRTFLLPLCLILAAAFLSACTVTASTPIPLPTAKVPSLNEVQGAIDRWESSANQNYYIAVEESSDSGTNLYRVVIVNGEVQAAQQLEKVDGVWQQPVALDEETAGQYTVDALLQRILRDVNGDGAAPLNMYIVFDNISGYPTLVDAKAIQSYAPDGRINLNREHSYVLTIEVGVLIEETFGQNKTPVLTLTRSGGERAACSTLRIYTDGASIYSDNCRQILLQLRPPADSFARLEALAAELAELTDSRALDRERLALTLHGTGSGSPDGEATEEIWELALDLDQLLSRPIGEGITLLMRGGDNLTGLDMRTYLEQPATLQLSPPLHGGIVNPTGRILIYSDADGVHWLDTVSGESGTYLSNTDVQWSVPIAVTGDGRIVLTRLGTGEEVEWGWIAPDDLAWHPLPDTGVCVTGVAASPVDGRLAVMARAGEGCDSEAVLWLVDLASDEASPIVTDFARAEWASWSSDGAWLAFTAPADESDGPEQVFLVRPDGSELTPLTDHQAGRVNGLAWDPSGDTLVYGVSGDPVLEDGLHEIDPETGDVLASLSGEDMRPVGFDASGEFLAFVDTAGLHVWVISFGQVQPAMQGDVVDAFIGFIGGGE